MLDSTDYVFKMISAPLIFAQLVLSCFTDNLPFHYISPGADVNNPSPKLTASILSILTFWWINSLVILGYRRPLKKDDLYDMDHENQTVRCYNRLLRYLDLKKKTSENGLILPLFRAFLPEIALTAAYKFISSLLMFVNPIILDYLLVWLVTREPLWHGYLFAFLMFASSVVDSMFSNQYEYNLAITAMRMRSALTELVYNKAFTLSPASKAKFTTGQIVNLMAVDSQKVVEFMMFANYIWASPLQISIATYLLWQQLGTATVAGIAIMLLLIPLNGYVTSLYRKAQIGLMRAKDKRSKMLNEIMSGIKVLKLYGWELSFIDQIKKTRAKEVENLRVQSYYMAIITFTLSCGPIFVAVFSFLTFILISEDNNLDPSKAFVSLSLFNLIRMPLTFLPLMLTFGTMFVVSMKRIANYINSDETDVGAVTHDPESKGGAAVEVKNASFSWTREFGDVNLNNIDLEIKPGQLVAVVGRVGSGKSSLMSALLGDMYKTTGSVNINGSLAYVSQQAWIQNATVRRNIVFTSPYDESRYKRVIEAAALTPDIRILAAGDETEIGEKGINLSGGQKQRVSLARAVYSDNDIYLMDDPLSAVDTHVGKHIFEKVIGPKGMLKDKTRILVTQKITLLPHVDMIIVMKDGKVSECGSYQELMDKKGAFSEFLIEYLAEEAPDDEEDAELVEIKEKMRPALERHLSRVSQVDLTSSSGSHKSGSLTASNVRAGSINSQDVKSRKSTQSPIKSAVGAGRPAFPKPATGRLVELEQEEVGGVSFGVYLEYFKAMGTWSVLLLLLFSIIANGLNIWSSLWLSIWTDDALDPVKLNDTSLRYVRIGVYGALGLGEALSTLVYGLLIFLGTLSASSILHNSMMERVMRAPMSFFDTTPTGRILNRFTKDIDALDSTIRMNFRQFLSAVFRTIVTLIVISLQTPFFLVAVLPLSVIYYVVQRYYIASSRQLKRIESTTRSPIYTHFSETVTGSTSIRAFDVVHQFTKELEDRVDRNAVSYLMQSATTRWLGVRLEFVGNIIVLFSALFSVTALGASDPALAGLSISYALTVTQTLNMVVRASVDIESNLVSAERCIEYTKVATEAAWFNEATKPAKSWPTGGLVVFDNYSTRYREGTDLVLRRCSFETGKNEKIGIVGRTGAGKSSLTLALFRLIEPTNGSIIIDDVDITRLGLQDLRSRLTIIPQDPVLFSGSLRMNLDPFEKYSDSELWDALFLSHLKDFVSGLEGGLEHIVTEGGENLSVGQRQLVCLARALLRKSKILILDEATAAVDVETDDLIQKTIRKEFALCTILTIAHRLNTVIDYDRILVLEDGQVAEFDTPRNLMQDSNGKFYSMARVAGLLNTSSSSASEGSGGGDHNQDPDVGDS